MIGISASSNMIVDSVSIMIWFLVLSFCSFSFICVFLWGSSNSLPNCKPHIVSVLANSWVTIPRASSTVNALDGVTILGNRCRISASA